MPGVSAVEEVRRARSTTLPGPAGWEPLVQRDLEVRLTPPLTIAEIAELEAAVGVPFPRELVNLLGETAGIEDLLGGVDFTGRTMDYEDRDLFPNGHPIAADGFGNFWVVDLTPSERDVSPVFYASHDAPVLLYQSANVGEFLHELFAMFTPPHESAVDAVHEDRLFAVWSTNPGLLDHAAALAADDTLRSFAEQLDERYSFADLRKTEVGMGFAWGRHGPRTEVRRHGSVRIFGVAPPAKRRGIFRRG
jgi:hypothetical protein